MTAIKAILFTMIPKDGGKVTGYQLYISQVNLNRLHAFWIVQLQRIRTNTILEGLYKSCK